MAYCWLINRYILLIIACLPVTIEAYAQSPDYAREVINTLASPAFKGRGYVKKGDKKAAQYIAQQFEDIGLKPYGKTHFQKFSTSVNTFPGQIHLALHDNTLTPGIDYLVEPGSPSTSGKFPVLSIEVSDILSDDLLSEKIKNVRGKIIIIPAFDKNEYSKTQLQRIDQFIQYLKYHDDNPASGTIILTKSKLTWSASTAQYSKPTFLVKADKWTSGIKYITLDVKNKFIEQYTTQNIIAYMEGKRTDSLIVLTAHYDHLGMMGENTIFPGANDNASGIAMLLNLAKYYQSNTPEYSIVFIAFAAEELGLLGAKQFVTNPIFPLSKIKFLINFDIAGTGDDGIQVVNGSVYPDQFAVLTSINNKHHLLKQVKIRGAACNSDHCMFDQAKVPGFFIYTLGGIQAYHDIYDKPETLPLTDFVDFFKLIIQFIVEI